MVLTSGFDNGIALQPIFLDDVRCAGTELTLASCPHLPFESHNCAHSEDVGVTCLPLDGKIGAILFACISHSSINLPTRYLGINPQWWDQFSRGGGIKGFLNWVLIEQ